MRVLEIEAAGPAPFCGMLLADLGADVVMVERKVAAHGPLNVPPAADAMRRGKKRVALDLKEADDRRSATALAAMADVLVEGFRPGVMERLGLGPTELLAAQPRLVYCRISGYGQEGRDSQRPAHDLNFLAESGALFHMGRAEDVPLPPMNLVADFGAAGSLATVGILAAVLHARRTGHGQVLDLSMLQACRLLLTSVSTWRAHGLFSPRRGQNIFDGSCPWYAVYRAGDGGMLAVASVEPRFYSSLLCVLSLTEFANAQMDRSRWPHLAYEIGKRLASRPREDWLAAFAGTEACVSRVDPMPAAAQEGWFARDGVLQPSSPFRFDHTAVDETPAIRAREDVERVIAAWSQLAQ